MSAPDDPDAWLEIIDRTESRVRRNTRRPRGAKAWAGVVLLGAVVAFISWMVARAPTTNLTGLADQLAGPVTTTAEGGSETAADGTTGAGGTGTSVVAELGEFDPTLTDYRLFASRSSELIEIDLATEEVTTHPVGGRLVGFFDGRLLLVEPSEGIVAVPVDEPEAEPETIVTVEPGGAQVASAVVDEDGILNVTVLDPAVDPLASSMIRLDLITGEEQRVDVPAVASMGLVDVPGGGLFELTADGFRPLTDASVRFFGLSYVLAERCDDPAQCRRFWLQRSTGVRITRPLPRLQVGYALGRNGRVAVGVQPGQLGFFDVRLAADISIEDPYRDVDDRWFVVEDLTPDERFLAAVVGDVGSDIVIHDLDTRNEIRFELGRSSPLSKLLFVPREGGQ